MLMTAIHRYAVIGKPQQCGTDSIIPLHTYDCSNFSFSRILRRYQVTFLISFQLFLSHCGCTWHNMTSSDLQTHILVIRQAIACGNNIVNRLSITSIPLHRGFSSLFQTPGYQQQKGSPVAQKQSAALGNWILNI